MPAWNGGSSLPFFSNQGNSGVASTRAILLPRSCLSPRIFLSCILATFSISWLLFYSYSHFTLDIIHSNGDSHDWTMLEKQLTGNIMHRENAIPLSTFSC